MAFTVNKKAFCVLEFAKTESIVTVQRRFRIMYHTEPPTDKTIRESYMNSSRVAACALRNEQAATLLEFMYHSRIVLSVGGSVWYMIRKLRCTVTIDSVLANSKTQNAFLFTVNAIFLHDYPLAVEPGSAPRPQVQKKKTWRDSLPIDMLLSAVSVLVVAQSSSEIPEGLMNIPVFKVKTRWYVLLPVSFNRLTPLVVHKTVIRSEERALFKV